MCCFLTGAFVLHVEGRLNGYDGITLIVAIIRWLFQKFTIPTFAIDHEFTFTLVNDDDVDMDMFHYSVSCCDITIPVSILGIDTDTLCGPLSNIDLVHIVWDNFIQFSYKRYALALAPCSTASPQPDLMFGKHHRVESDCWRDSGNCDDCVDFHKELLLPYNDCDLSPMCPCKICSRQPQSLADCARHVLFQFALHLDNFRLETDTTHDQYVYAVRSNRVPQADLLPPESPMITVWYYSNVDSPL